MDRPWKHSYSDLVDEALVRIREQGAEGMLDLGAETKMQNRLNRDYMDKLSFEMRILNSARADISTTLLGYELPSPIITCQWCEYRLMNATVGSQAYIPEVARAIAEVGALMQLTVQPEYLQEIVEIPGARIISIFTAYHTSRGSEDQLIEFTIRDAEERGAIAVGVDMNCFYGEKVGDEWPYQIPQAAKTVEQMRRYRESTDLPFIVNGVLSVQDARICLEEIGADALGVGHNFGEAVDYAVPVLKILPEIRESFPDAVLIADTGFMRGTDVLKALALGADAVAMLEPFMLAYIAEGGEGVVEMYRVLCDELRRTMSLTGCTDVASIDPSILHHLH